MFNKLILDEGMEIGCFCEGEDEISERKFLNCFFSSFFFFFGKGFEENKKIKWWLLYVFTTRSFSLRLI